MALHRIKKGLDLPISGAPQQQVLETPRITRVAILADDFPGMKPRMAVQEGDTVKRGQLLFEDRKSEGVRFTAPGAGKVVGIHRGAKRALQSLVIHLNDNEQAGTPTQADVQPFTSFQQKSVEQISPSELRALLIESGLWTAFRTRPFSRVPQATDSPAAIFVTAVDTNPLAPDPQVVIAEQAAHFEEGLKLVSKLTTGSTFLCTAEGSTVVAGSAPVQHEQFAGPHPSGTVGLHIHTLFPVSRERVVWHIGYQDVIAIHKLVQNGWLDVTQTVSIGGPSVKKPRLVRARQGAMIDDILSQEFSGLDGQVRIISGSVLHGKKAEGLAFGYLGRFANQVSVLREGRERELLGWIAPGKDRFSTLPIFLSKLVGTKTFDFSTATHGSTRPMVPIGAYERVMPMDIMPTFLLRALAVGDIERAEKLGMLELDEEDLSLCTFVCPGKMNYGIMLRKNLQTIQEEG